MGGGRASWDAELTLREQGGGGGGLPDAAAGGYRAVDGYGAERASNACSLVLLVTIIYTIIIRLNNIIYILYCNLYSVFRINSIGVLIY